MLLQEKKLYLPMTMLNGSSMLYNVKVPLKDMVLYREDFD